MTMEHYTKGEVSPLEEIEEPCFKLHEHAVHMTVNYGSKIRNLMGFALKKMQEPTTKQIVWTGSGSAIPKAISCAEILKRKIKGLYQINKIRYKRITETWLPKMEDLDRLIVNRDIPTISILLSKEKLDPEEPGYQAPGKCSILLSHENKQKCKTKEFSKTSSSQSRHPYQTQKQFKRKRRQKPTSGEAGSNRSKAGPSSYEKRPSNKAQSSTSSASAPQ